MPLARMRSTPRWLSEVSVGALVVAALLLPVRRAQGSCFGGEQTIFPGNYAITNAYGTENTFDVRDRDLDTGCSGPAAWSTAQLGSSTAVKQVEVGWYEYMVGGDKAWKYFWEAQNGQLTWGGPGYASYWTFVQPNVTFRVASHTSSDTFRFYVDEGSGLVELLGGGLDRDLLGGFVSGWPKGEVGRRGGTGTGASDEQHHLHYRDGATGSDWVNWTNNGDQGGQQDTMPGWKALQGLQHPLRDHQGVQSVSMSRAASPVLALLLSGGVLVGCADISAPFEERSGSSVPPDVEVDAGGSWTNVIAGERMTLNALVASAPFAVVIPSGLGDPIGAYLLDVEEQSPGQSVVEFDYDVEGIGRVVVEEAPPEVPRSEWKDYIDLLVSQNGSEMMQGTATLVEVRGGSPALMTTSADGSVSDIRWLESDVLEVYIRGPMLSSEECLKLAEQV